MQRSSHRVVGAASKPDAMQGGGKPPKLLNQVRERVRRLGYSSRTEEAYVGWTRRFILANGVRHPRELSVTRIGSSNALFGQSAG